MAALAHEWWPLQVAGILLTFAAVPFIGVLTARQIARWSDWNLRSYYGQMDYDAARNVATIVTVIVTLIYWPAVWGLLVALQVCAQGILLVSRMYPWWERQADAIEQRSDRRRRIKQQEKELRQRAEEAADEWLKETMR